MKVRCRISACPVSAHFRGIACDPVKANVAFDGYAALQDCIVCRAILDHQTLRVKGTDIETDLARFLQATGLLKRNFIWV